MAEILVIFVADDLLETDDACRCMMIMMMHGSVQDCKDFAAVFVTSAVECTEASKMKIETSRDCIEKWMDHDGYMDR